MDRILLVLFALCAALPAQLEPPALPLTDGFALVVPGHVVCVEYASDGAFVVRDASIAPLADPPQSLVTEWKCSFGTMRVVTPVPPGSTIDALRAIRARHKQLVEVMQEPGGGFEPITGAYVPHGALLIA